jgi:hypothetical protein
VVSLLPPRHQPLALAMVSEKGALPATASAMATASPRPDLVGSARRAPAMAGVMPRTTVTRLHVRVR